MRFYCNFWASSRSPLQFLLILCLSVARAADDLPGSIHGVTKFPGEAPPRSMFANASDHDCPHGIPQTHLLVKFDSRVLQNVLIVLERNERRVMPTRLQATLETKGCQILPRVQVLPLGTSLLVVNKDNAHHHIHAWQGGNTVFEADVDPEGAPARRPLVVPGLYKVNCDRHLWERAWIWVSPHDSVAVTDAQGEFTIHHVSPGRYRLRAWHEGWVSTAEDRDGRLEYQPMEEVLDVKVRKDETTEVVLEDFTPAFGSSDSH